MAVKEERVKIFVERDSSNNDPNLFVSINGVNYLLPKGKESLVPVAVAEEVIRSQKAKEVQNQMIDNLLAASK